MILRTRFPYLFCWLITASLPLLADPVPGDVYREYTYAIRFSELDPGSKRPGLEKMRANIMNPRVITLPALDGVVRAEVSVEYWGGHIGTTGQRVKVNDGDWIDIPQPVGTPGAPQCYYRTLLGRATAAVPLEQLKNGPNVLRFTAGPQACHGFDWGFYWVYAFTVRLYYDTSTPHPEGHIVSPAEGAVIGDNPRVLAVAQKEDAGIARADFIGEYEDFNWEGDGKHRQWHYITERGEITHHIGSAFREPWAAVWDTSWLPDQDQPVRLAARIVDRHGVHYITPAVTVRLRRNGRSVKMFRAADLPEKFGVRVEKRMECRIPVSGPLSGARAARLVLSTWSAAHASKLSLNGVKLADRVGYVHNYSFDALPVPRNALKERENVFSIYSKTTHHAAEVNWPGPALLIEYGPPAMKPLSGTPWWDNSFRFRLPVEVSAGTWDRRDRPAEVRLDLGIPSVAAMRVVEVEAGGAVSSAEVPFQFEPESPGTGLLTLLLEGMTARGTTRRYHVYFNTGASHTPLCSANPVVSLSDDVVFEGQKSYRIATPAGTYLYHKEGAGFAGLQDPDGAEWIGYHPGGRSAGEFRGIPNLGDFGHPGYSGEKGAVSRILSAGPVKIAIRSESRDGQYAALWEIFPRFARMTMQRTAKPYWFLYEGTPEGRLDLKDGIQVLSTGLARGLSEHWSGDMPDPEWIYFGSPKGKRVIFLVNHQADDAPDQYWPMEGNMTVFGFGRQYRCCDKYLSVAPAQFSIGLAPNGSFDALTRTIEGTWRNPAVSLGAVQKAR